MDAKREAGERLKRAIHVARAKAGLTSDVQVATRSHVSYDTLMNWFGGRTNPRGFELRKVADALDTSYALLEASYNGTEPEPLPLHDAIAKLVPVLEELVAELRLSRAESVVLIEHIGDSLRRQVPDGRLTALTEEGRRRLDALETPSPRPRSARAGRSTDT